jgi:G3E family GTPase
MGDPRTHVYLITGFLGSGKTTFLNRVLDGFHGQRRLVVLMNEFGEIGLDGALIHGEGFDLVEISRGSVFCVCVKTDFIKALHEIAHRLRPDLLLIESTGVADPTGLKRDLGLPIFRNRFRLVEQFCIVDAVHFEDAFEVFASLEKQIRSSSVFIINKKDLASPEQIDRVKEIVRRIHPEPGFIEAAYGDIPLDGFFAYMDKAGEQAREDVRDLSAELEETIDRNLSFPTIDLMPPDRLVSAVYEWRGAAFEPFQGVMNLLPAGLVRGKGFIAARGETRLFNLVMGKPELTPASLPEGRAALLNRIVFIGPPEAMDGLESLSLENPLLSRQSLLDPMASSSPDRRRPQSH